MADARYRNFQDPVRGKYAFDLFDPSTWSQGVVGAGSNSIGVSEHDGEEAFERDVIRRRFNVGRGPKGYRRNDRQIYEEICESLTRNNDVDASEMTVRVMDGVVELTGRAHDRLQKFIAEDIVAGVMGVKEIRNLLHVERSFRYGVPVGGWPI